MFDHNDSGSELLLDVELRGLRLLGLVRKNVRGGWASGDWTKFQIDRLLLNLGTPRNSTEDMVFERRDSR